MDSNHPKKSQNMQSVHILVNGRVQGVGFRRFAQKEAQQLGLTGWTRNLLDGRVEIKATGSLTLLESFQLRLQQGPTFSHVAEVIVKKLEVLENFSNFSIKEDQEMPVKAAERK